MVYQVSIDGKNYRLELERTEGLWHCCLDGKDMQIDPVLARPDVLSVLIDGKAYEIKREHTATDMHLWVGPVRYAAELHDQRSLRSRRQNADQEKGPRKLAAPMPGKVVRLLVKEGNEVEAGQGLVVVEAMKMQNEVKSPKRGVVQKMIAIEGATVNAGDVLIIVE
jgi:biotin carboxyl carrier protein